VFAYPESPGCYAAIPSMEAMQQNLVVPSEDLYEVVTFHWKEPDKDNLEVKGTLQIKPL